MFTFTLTVTRHLVIIILKNLGPVVQQLLYSNIPPNSVSCTMYIVTQITIISQAYLATMSLSVTVTHD